MGRLAEMRALATRLRKLEAKRPSGVCALSDEELDARMDAGLAALLAEYGSVDALAASCRAAGNEPRVLWRAIVNGPFEQRLQKLKAKHRVECPAVFRLSGGALPSSVLPHGVIQ